MDLNRQDYFFSIVVPVYNNEDTIKAALSSIFGCDYANLEVIVVNDGSSDHSALIAGEFRCEILNLEKNSGAAAARNAGARVAKGDIILFIDSDVIISRDTLSLFNKAFREDSWDAVVGIYGREKVFLNPLSVYKNLFLHFNQDNNSFRFWSGCLAIRKNTFLRLGGFDENLKGALSSEDTAFGYIFRKNGCKIQIKRDIQVAHNHKYTLRSLLKNEFFKTAAWFKLLMRNRQNVKTGGYYLNIRNFLSLFCILVIAVSTPFIIAKGHPFFIIVLFCFFIFLLLNINFYYLLIKEGGWKYFILGPPLHALSYVASILGIFYAFISLFKTRG